MPRRRKKPIEPLTPKEVEQLIRAGSRRAPTGVRNRALIATLYYAGLRIGEALALLPRDLELETCAIRVRRGKGGNQRTVAIHGSGVQHLALWMERRRSLPVARADPVFCTLTGGPVAQQYVRAMLVRYARRAGIDKRIHPHGLRHSHAAHLAMQQVPIHLIRKQLGHATLHTTGTYLDEIAPGDVIAAIEGLEW